MLPYLVLGLIIGTATTVGGMRKPNPVFFLGMCLLLVLFIGLRHRVSVDWNNYLIMILRADTVEGMFDILRVSEPLYAILLIWGNWTGFGIYAANLVTAIVVIAGLWRFARITPEPWLALMAALPYYLVVFAMGANRQAMAAGILMWLTAEWYNYGFVKRVFLVILAVGFHFSALIYFFFIGWEVNANLKIKIFLLLVFGFIVFYILKSTGYLVYYGDNYLFGVDGEKLESSGALFHAALNAIPASLYFIFPKYRKLLFPNALMRHLAFAAMVTLPISILASTAGSRISVYWYPVSIWVWSALPIVLVARSRPFVRFATSAIMLAILAGWLTYANSAYWYQPYQNALFLNSWELDIGRTRW